ncbi:sulfur oxidation c-type cytochrome SoxX [Bradyrhizobium liaoningense]|uniref:sulfur oxidation c-type cytochrome SoxX n=1 Tax=Bradyrhizobium liaoningense TaxID=43992 RepID=UPI001BAC53B5|nr:sulfur oxidation c-type cytochrome SoxX [Bradyrhizobium liaoningense]MBR0713391.1 sulfur oxidation c-type cytochrome SoxX [Bradyrhizobium liaoningense]
MRCSLAAAVALCLSAAGVCAQEPAKTPIKLDIVNDALPKSLTGTPGNAEAGRKVFLTRTLGNCLACHQVTSLKSEEFHGEFGPSLDGVAGRYTEAQLRLIVADPKRIFTDTVMPAFFRNEGLSRVRPEFVGKSILTAAQVEDVIAFLKTLN